VGRQPEGMALNPVTQNTFTAEVLESEQPVLVDFWAAWCPPCRLMNPILDELAAAREDIKIVSVDADEEQDLAARYGVLGLPTFVLFDNGAPVSTLVGARPKRRLESELEQALAQQPAGR
jgi:thioredoxin 1